MRFIKVGNRIINLELVSSISLVGPTVTFWLKLSCEIEIDVGHPSREAVSHWISDGMPMPASFLDIDAWHTSSHTERKTA